MPRDPVRSGTDTKGRLPARMAGFEGTRRLTPVLWTKGGLLTPQHLQQQDRFVEDSLHFRLQATSFRPYGFLHVDVDRHGLAEGQFSLTGASGVFPDGLLFDIPRADAPPPIKQLKELFAGLESSSLDVYLAIQHQRSDRAAIANAQAGAETRYFAETIEVRDETRSSSEKPIQVVRRNFRLITSAEPTEGWDLLPVARVLRSDSGFLKADDRFIPPLLDFHASPHLEANASGILQVLTARMSELSDFRRGRAPSPTDFGASEIRAFGLLHTIHTHFPVLKHLLDVSPVHPERLYATLLSLAGSLSTFADYERSADLPLYNHDDLTECFNALTARISLLLETIVRKRWLSLPLKSVAPSIYAAALDQPELLQDADVFLLITADVEPAVLIHKVPEMLIVAAGTRIDHMVGHAVPGIPLMHIARPPAELPVRREHTYFRIEKKNQAWTSVAGAGSLAVYIPAAFPNPRAELMVLLADAR